MTTNAIEQEKIDALTRALGLEIEAILRGRQAAQEAQDLPRAVGKAAQIDQSSGNQKNINHDQDGLIQTVDDEQDIERQSEGTHLASDSKRTRR